MLPALLSKARTPAIITLTALSVALVPAAPALAWDKTDRAFVKGVLATLLVTKLIRDSQAAPAQPAYVPPTQATYSPATGNIYATPTAKAFQSYTLTERQRIQRRLAGLGYYRSGIDGAFGPGTYSAISAYAADQGETARLTSTTGAFAILDGLLY